MRIIHLPWITYRLITKQVKYIWASQGQIMVYNDSRKGLGRRALLVMINIGDIKENDTIVAKVGIICIPQHLRSGIQETRSAFVITILSKNRSSWLTSIKLFSIASIWILLRSRRNLETAALRFSVDRKHFENGAFRKRWCYDNHVISPTEFSSNTNSKWSMIVAFLNASGVVWTENIRCVSRVKPPFSKCLQRRVDRTIDSEFGPTQTNNLE